MVSFPRRYWPAIPIAAVFAAGVFFEWKSANGPRQQTYAAAPQIPALGVSQPQAPSALENGSHGSLGTVPKIESAVEKDDAKTQKESDDPNNRLADYTLMLVIFTGGLVGTGLLTIMVMRNTDRTYSQQLAATHRANEHFQVTERAYVKMSHETPTDRPALQWTEASDGFHVSVEVRNHGRTPARITDILLTYRVLPNGQEFPAPIPYVRHPDDIRRTRAFLVCDDSFKAVATYRISPAEAARVGAQQAILIFYGYVDYIDQFGQRHRGGYGRQYALGTARNNLVYPDIATINYDRKRRLGEGRDWSDE